MITGIVGGFALIVIGSAAFVGHRRMKEVSSRQNTNYQVNLRDAAVGNPLHRDIAPTHVDVYAMDDAERARSSSVQKGLHRCVVVPLWARIAVPLGLAAVFVLFVTAHISTGARVAIYIFYGDQRLVDYGLFTFTLANSVRDMWNAKVYALSLLIAVCSGGWPYLKTILLAAAWFLPRRMIGMHKRERLLMWLDMLGKWSLIDAYVLVLFVVAFRFHIANPELLVPGDIASVDVFVEPGWGIYGFLIAAILQLILTHVIIHFHREAEGKHKHMREEHSSTSDAVRSHWFKFGSQRGKVQCTWLGQSIVALLLAISVGNVILGSFIKSFSFEFKGAAAVVLRLVNSPYESEYSVLSLAKYVSSSAYDPNNTGIRFLQVMYLIFVFLVPVIHLITILGLWLIPFTVAAQRRVFIAAEVLNAWASLEVFVVSIIASILEISQFAKFIVGDSCDQIDVLLRVISTMLPGVYPPTEEMVCFDVRTKLENGCWVLFGASLGAIAIGQLVTRSCQRALEDRIELHSQELADDGAETSSEHGSSSCCGSSCGVVAKSMMLLRLVRSSESFANPTNKGFRNYGTTDMAFS
eukprot:c20756_g1_i1.p1 GENE.c20756_g1_i1~~c20756_g1_i1.p1  ORF type:complete len:620 (-),score=213.93 c20756_g1_i1:79-1821(-)